MVNSYNILSAFALAGACPLDLRLPCGCLSPLICVCHCGCLSPSPAFAIAGACPLHLRLLLQVCVSYNAIHRARKNCKSNQYCNLVGSTRRDQSRTGMNAPGAPSLMANQPVIMT